MCTNCNSWHVGTVSYLALISLKTTCQQLTTSPFHPTFVIHCGYLAKIVNMETAFLYEELEAEICMECLQGMYDVGEDDCIILNKCIYSLVEAAWLKYKKTLKILRK